MPANVINSYTKMIGYTRIAEVWAVLNFLNYRYLSRQTCKVKWTLMAMKNSAMVLGSQSLHVLLPWN